MTNRLSLKSCTLSGKRVLMRVDFNVPLSAKGDVADDYRIIASLPSIKFILEQNGSLILMSHLGRPKGSPDSRYSLKPVAKRLGELLEKPILFVSDCVSSEAKNIAFGLRPGQILMLENLRFHPGETDLEKEPEFAHKLAELGNVYVNDAFGVAHRLATSTCFIPKYFLGQVAFGLLMEKEIASLTPLMHNADHPFYIVLGGAKVSSKLGLIRGFVQKADLFFVGGGMAFTFLKAAGFKVGSSLVEEGLVDKAKEWLSAFSSIQLPTDLVVADHFDSPTKWEVVSVKEGVPAGWYGVDIGPETIRDWSKLLQNGAILFWNGPLGVCEIGLFRRGTDQIGAILAQSQGRVVVGGGETVAAIRQAGLERKFFHVSTGGGALMEFLEFGHLPAIDSLIEATTDSMK